MADINLKNLTDIPVVEPSESTHLLAEQDGAYARVPKDKVGGGASSWNDLKDKPFYSEGFYAEWDGVVGDRVEKVMRDAEGYRLSFVKISNEIISYEAVISGKLSVSNGLNLDISERYVNRMTDVMAIADGYVLVIEKDGTQLDIGAGPVMFDDSGVYFMRMETPESVMYTTLFDCSDTKKIEKKFLPYKEEVWTFTLEDGSTVDKKVVMSE